MDFEGARKLVEQQVNERWEAAGHAAKHGPLVVVRHIEKPYGWIFFYTAEKFLQTRSIEHAIAGNGPIIVEKATGKLSQLGTATAPEEQIRIWEKMNWKL